MSIDRHAAERRRFARLLGIDGELGSGLPIGEGPGRVSQRSDEVSNETASDRTRESSSNAGSDEEVTEPRDLRETS
ncbi:hypothetical protein [Natrarchaeobius chitinivorans]|uniref:Uncharacterized protein n=1 Tax=Natrarchaeobius chitinivorans TaxID=1679083 RepID=A0A3N6PIE9_NATCH|nr:hypothetical protein [Natrarchaeobius chitinivorans]RQG98035.1 hypothetical protein EA473_02270 [Natrarchaeobius chitinivorans]